jgi:hypothetical protein
MRVDAVILSPSQMHQMRHEILHWPYWRLSEAARVSVVHDTAEVLVGPLRIRDHITTDELVIQLAKSQVESLTLVFGNDRVCGFDQRHSRRTEFELLILDLRHDLVSPYGAVHRCLLWHATVDACISSALSESASARRQTPPSAHADLESVCFITQKACGTSQNSSASRVTRRAGRFRLGTRMGSYSRSITSSGMLRIICLIS